MDVCNAIKAIYLLVPPRCVCGKTMRVISVTKHSERYYLMSVLEAGLEMYSIYDIEKHTLATKQCFPSGTPISVQERIEEYEKR